MSSEAVVRSDGKLTVALISEVFFDPAAYPSLR